MKEKIKLVIVFILGIMISVVISVYAATVIGAGEVSYTDNKGIGASNVQDAINGVYTNSNTLASNVTSLTTRVTALESKKVTWMSVVNAEGIYTSDTTVNTFNSRKFSDYKTFYFIITAGSAYHFCGVVNLNVFVSGAAFRCAFNLGGKLYNAQVKYVSDTSVKLLSDYTAGNVHYWIAAFIIGT